MINLFSKSHWFNARKEYMTAARQCRETLTNPEGFWRYSPDDERVKAALATWVNRARNAHSIALGRRPVIANALVINQSDVRTGSLHAA